MIDRCPWCGMVQDGTNTAGDIHFKCGTWVVPEKMSDIDRSHQCKDRQIAKLKARNEKLEIVAKAAKLFRDSDAPMGNVKRSFITGEPIFDINDDWTELADKLADALDMLEPPDEKV